jgi:molybdate transport system substrate-binding protein
MLVGPLPREHELATGYTAGVCTRAARPEEAARLAGMLAGEAARGIRERLGFEAAA